MKKKKKKKKEQADLTQPGGGEEDERRLDGGRGSAWWTPISDGLVNADLPVFLLSLCLSLCLSFLWWEEQMMLLEGFGGEKEIKERG